VKAFFDAVAFILAWPAALSSQIEHAIAPNSEGLFLFWAQTFALLPGLPGVFLRRAFYKQTLQHCGANVHIGFGAYFTHREARVEQNVYIGPYALLGSVILRKHCLIGSRASLLSGGQLHVMDDAGNWDAADRSRMRQIEIGEYAWLGEGALTMANVGARAMVAAGSVVSTAVPERVMVAGNPARFVRKLVPSTTTDAPSAPAVTASPEHPGDTPR
jgi:acetyltransferase-like isoleucine patch superfamily enzyme